MHFSRKITLKHLAQKINLKSRHNFFKKLKHKINVRNEAIIPFRMIINYYKITLILILLKKNFCQTSREVKNISNVIFRSMKMIG